MKIVFLTTQSSVQSTLVGRVVPLAKQFITMGHTTLLLVHREKDSKKKGQDSLEGVPVRITGVNPFSRSVGGKKRSKGFYLLWTMKINAWRAAWALVTERPDVIVLVKPLPENTLAAVLARPFLWNTKIVLDVDDFELFANNLSSLMERAAIHASERVATAISSHIVVATPFLYDHIHQMVAGKKDITLIPTGLDLIPSSLHDPLHAMAYIGSLSVSSGHRVDLLPEILSAVRKHVPDATLLLAGSGDDEAMVRKQFEALGVSDAVTYVGRFSLQDIPSILAKTDVLLDPIDSSIVSRAKSSFRTALALVAGVPVVTSNIGIRTELIPKELHKNLFALPQDAASYAERISALLTAPLSGADRVRMIDQSKKYTWKHLGKKYNQLFV
jgi:glycosyltransferase involved in cell wall biosynthesis